MTARLTALARAFENTACSARAVEARVVAFAGSRRVLDVGCGHGAFLSSAGKVGIDGVGIELDPVACSQCRERGLEVLEGNAIELLIAMRDGEPFEGVLLSHVIEHMEPGRASQLLAAIHGVLAPGGRLVVVTPNIKNLLVATEFFWLDPTHVRPYPRALLEVMGRQVGFQVVRSYDDPGSRLPRPLWRDWIQRLRSTVSGADRAGPLDAVVEFARKG